MWAAQNRDVAGLVFIKASGSLVWGASDVLYVRRARAGTRVLRRVH